MNQLSDATHAIANALGITATPTPVEKGFTVPAGWTTLAALMEGASGNWEFALTVDPVLSQALGGEEAALQTLVQALETQGKVVAAALGATLADEAQLAISTEVVGGFVAQSANGSVAVLVAGSPLPATEAPAEKSAVSAAAKNDSRLLNGGVRLLGDVEMEVTAELGRTSMTVRELLSLVPGSVVELDRIAGAPIDVLVNGTVIARGEVVVVDEEFGVRVTEILDPDFA